MKSFAQMNNKAYYVEARRNGFVEYESRDLFKNQAISLAQEWATDLKDLQVFVGCQNGYLNPDGSHSPVGKHW